MSDAPPTDLNVSELRRQYPETPMPESAANSEPDSDYGTETSAAPSMFQNAILILCIGVCIAHLVTVWTLRADVNILLEYQKEQSLQYQHISKMLELKQQLQWQIVPAHK
jgi:hypothetical protein